MAVKVTLEALRSAVNSAQAKVEESTASDRDQRILDSQITAANERVKQAESSVTQSQLTKQQAQDKLSPPPTKQIQGDDKKGRMKTVVDEQEKNKLQAQVRAADVQIQQAQATVEDAKAEAQDLTAQSLSDAGVTDQQQQSMNDLSSLMEQLKAAANDSQTNLEGDDFQTKLQTAVEKIGELSEDLPKTPNENLKEFWKDIQGGISEVQNKFITATSPDPYEIQAGDRGNNYSQFFTDYNEGITSLVEGLQEKGIIDSGAGRRILGVRDALMGNASKSLQGVTSGTGSDEEKMEKLMNTVNGLVNSMNRDRDISGNDINKLITDSQSLTDNVLVKGGSNLEGVLEAQLNTMDGNSGVISDYLTRNGRTSEARSLENLRAKFAAIADTKNFVGSKENPKGLSKADADTLNDFEERLSAMVSTINPVNNGQLDSATLSQFMRDSNAFISTLTRNYGINANRSSSSSNFGSSSNNNQLAVSGFGSSTTV